MISVTLMALVVATVSIAFSVVVRSEGPTTDLTAEAHDLGLLQATTPHDLAATAAGNTDPLFQPVSGLTLDGSNIYTNNRIDASSSSIVSYRYVQRGVDWLIMRFEVSDAGTASQTVTSSVVSHEAAEPPVGWVEGDPATHAAFITVRNPDVKPIAQDLTVHFRSGNQVVIGGTGLSSGEVLAPYAAGTQTDPQAPRSRCGGRIALVLDTSGSVPNQSGGRSLEDAAVGFIEGFQGTPSEMTIVGFDFRSYQMFPAGASGQYFDLLTDDVSPGQAKDRVLKLDDVDGAFYSLDPNGDGVHWNQTGAATNWEDGLWRTLRTDAGGMMASLPELVVFVTDGSPNVNRTSPAIEGSVDSVDVSRAVTVANDLRSQGARVIGVLVGAAATNSGAVSRLKQVVGEVTWTGTGPTNIGNADVADLFVPQTGSFQKLGDVFKAIIASECGGNLTIQKQIEIDGQLTDPDGPWTYFSEIGASTLNPATNSSVTFDFTLNAGESWRTVEIQEEPVAGYELREVRCTKGGDPLPSGYVTELDDATPGVRVRVEANSAVACTFISRPDNSGSGSGG